MDVRCVRCASEQERILFKFLYVPVYVEVVGSTLFAYTRAGEQQKNIYSHKMKSFRLSRCDWCSKSNYPTRVRSRFLFVIRRRINSSAFGCCLFSYAKNRTFRAEPAEKSNDENWITMVTTTVPRLPFNQLRANTTNCRREKNGEATHRQRALRHFPVWMVCVCTVQHRQLYRSILCSTRLVIYLFVFVFLLFVSCAIRIAKCLHTCTE